MLLLLNWMLKERKESLVNAQDDDGMTPLHLAVLSGKGRIVRKLKQRGASTLIKNAEGQTPLDLLEAEHQTMSCLTDKATSCQCLVEVAEQVYRIVTRYPHSGDEQKKLLQVLLALHSLLFLHLRNDCFQLPVPKESMDF